MFMLALSFLALVSKGELGCLRSSTDEVFVNEEGAKSYLSRRLLLNRFDFEIFVPGNLERECFEEICNYEEAREVFENNDQTDIFWKTYTEDKGQRPNRVDVTSLLIGLIVAAVVLVLVALLIWYYCQGKYKDMSRASSIRVRTRRSNASVVIQRLEEVSLQPVNPQMGRFHDTNAPGLPSYDQAIANSGQYDAPPPPYPGSRAGSTRR